jgi:phage baseplate assembly protein W
MATNTLTNIYSDIDLTFTPQPVTGDVSLVLDSRAVVNSVRNLLLTNFYDRPWQPGIGSNVTGLLFEPMSGITSTSLVREITDVIKNFEPRAKVNNVLVTEDYLNNGYNVSMSFFIGNSVQPTTITVFLERVR